MTDQHDFGAHQKTYDGFMTLLKFSTAAVVAVLVLLAVFLL